ncbi:hypothetical protein C461_02151 [Halorubrum aidingense JCM 13560]|uniref:DUF7513 domain-containing protein n=1 Tax=Halorubrum aidingense JCM 13560 TaxID=1230454 RepID=M0PHY5_9EURY|nr:hypothetical protein [Halorubrum aidingense]EMA69691.1 hypothetical protein C461_02151 [Halorubrum aidingense JCM 13560]
MSRFEKFLAGWSFRSSTPDYAVGDVIEVMVTGDEGDTAVARIGDSTLRIEGAPDDAVNTRVLVAVDAWDEASHAGTGTYRETVGKSAF